MKKKTVLMTLIIVGMFSNVSFAQNAMGAVNFTVGQPKGEFASNVENNGYGVSGYFNAQISPLLTAGFEGSFLVYGSEKRVVPFSTTIPDVTVEVGNSNNIAAMFLTMGISPKGKSVQPYANGLVGFNWLVTTTNITGDGFGEVDEIASSTNLSDFTFAYGVNGGLRIKVYENEAGIDLDNYNSNERKMLHFYLDLGVRFINGGEAEYLRKGDIQRIGAKVDYDIQKSKTNMFSYHIGLAVGF